MAVISGALRAFAEDPDAFVALGPGQERITNSRYWCHPERRGGGKGIRTLEPLAGLTVFKTVAFVRSAIPPPRV